MELRSSCNPQPRTSQKDPNVRELRMKRPIEKNFTQPKKSRNGEKIDKYCWKCHMPGQERICAVCPRVFHMECLKEVPFNLENVCTECRMVSLEGTDICTESDPRIKDLMKNAINKVFSVKSKVDIKGVLNWTENSEKLFQVMDVDTIEKKIEAGSYKRPVELLSDFRWIVHNCFILYGANAELAKTAKSLESELKILLTDLESCPDCIMSYFRLNDVDAFGKPCERTHDIVFSRIKGHPYWPAKVLRILENGKARVCFFGTYEINTVTAGNWFYLQSEQATQKQRQFSEAMKELLLYINNTTFEFSQGMETTNEIPERITVTTQTSADLNGNVNNQSEEGTISLELSENTDIKPIRNSLPTCIERDNICQNENILESPPITSQTCSVESAGETDASDSDIEILNDLPPPTVRLPVARRKNQYSASTSCGYFSVNDSSKETKPTFRLNEQLASTARNCAYQMFYELGRLLTYYNGQFHPGNNVKEEIMKKIEELEESYKRISKALEIRTETESAVNAGNMMSEGIATTSVNPNPNRTLSNIRSSIMPQLPGGLFGPFHKE